MDIGTRIVDQPCYRFWYRRSRKVSLEQQLEHQGRKHPCVGLTHRTIECNFDLNPQVAQLFEPYQFCAAYRLTQAYLSLACADHLTLCHVETVGRAVLMYSTNLDPIALPGGNQRPFAHIHCGIALESRQIKYVVVGLRHHRRWQMLLTEYAYR
ncbi:hypothetical protein D3C77_367020 [compost metagenome]